MPNDMKKLIARYIRDVIGGTPRVYKYWDDNNKSSIDIFDSVNRMSEGISTYSTIGLSDYLINKTVKNKILRVEIMGACYNEIEYFQNIIATCAFNIINSNFIISPGEVHRSVVTMYYPESEMKHITFVSPFLWDNPINISIDDYYITWLLALPVSPREEEYLYNNGLDELENLFEREGINIFDINRRSIL